MIAASIAVVRRLGCAVVDDREPSGDGIEAPRSNDAIAGGLLGENQLGVTLGAYSEFLCVISMCTLLKSGSLRSPAYFANKPAGRPDMFIGCPAGTTMPKA
jgi:hypothetical protein